MDPLLASAERIKDVGRGAGALLVGVAAADAFNEYVPEGHRPEDVLPGARSVIVAACIRRSTIHSLFPCGRCWQPTRRRSR